MVLSLAIAAFPIMGNAAGITYNKYKDFVYTDYNALSDGTTEEVVRVTNYKGKKTKITVPAEINGKKVTVMNGFKNAKKVKSIHIPKYVMMVRVSELPNLKKVTISKENKWFTVKNNLILNKKKTVLISSPGGKNNPTIPNSVKRIGHLAFVDSTIKKVMLGKNVTRIVGSAFEGCKKLAEVKLNNKLKVIESFAFEDCKSLKSIKIPKSVNKIGENAFFGCKNLKKIYIYNKKCKLDKDEYFCAIPNSVTIYGYKGSTAEKYAKKNGNKFVAL